MGLKKIANGWQRESMANKLRQARLSLLREVIGTSRSPVTILDVGGQEEFWKALDLSRMPPMQITLLNRYPLRPQGPSMNSMVGDSRDMSQIGSRAFDVVFSNSVLEHVGGLREQKAMARECLRVGKKHFIQTPNRYFPLEPHFLVPFFQFFPTQLRAWLHHHFDLGWWRKAKNYYEALEEVESIRLLSCREFAYLFPQSKIWREKLFGITKSFVAHSSTKESPTCPAP